MKGLKENEKDENGKLEHWKLTQTCQTCPSKITLEELAQASSL